MLATMPLALHILSSIAYKNSLKSDILDIQDLETQKFK